MSLSLHASVTRHNYGFSLVELSIVLVILGLLTGGILAGQSLIRAAELRSVSSDTQRYTASIQTFRDKYMALPGDMREATRFWTILAGDGINATCQNTAATSTPTCNGNGDGWINSSGSVTFDERFRAWQHLGNAGLVEGSYTGRTSGANGSAACGTDGRACPMTKLGSSTTYSFASIGTAGDTNVFARPSQANYIFLGSDTTPGLTPEELWSIDTKLDDGRPAYGRIFTTKRTASFCSLCVTTDVESTAEYAVTDSTKRCCPYFQLP